MGLYIDARVIMKKWCSLCGHGKGFGFLKSFGIYRWLVGIPKQVCEECEMHINVENASTLPKQFKQGGSTGSVLHSPVLYCACDFSEARYENI